MKTKDNQDTIRELDKLSIHSNPTELCEIFGERFVDAWSLIVNRKVKKYVFSPSGRKYWTVEGKDCEYLILPASGFCSCLDFYHKTTDSGSPCKHLLARRLAETLFDYHVQEVEDSAYEELMDRWRNMT